MRGEVDRLRSFRGAQGHEQARGRYAVVVQSDSRPLPTWPVAPTSTSARAATLRPEVSIDGRPTRVLTEQTSAVDPQRSGDSAGHLSFDELRQVDAALRLGPRRVTNTPHLSRRRLTAGHEPYTSSRSS